MATPDSAKEPRRMRRILRVTLRESAIAVLTNVSLANGTLGTFSNGTLALTDADGDGTLSAGDFFTITGGSSNRYELDVSVFDGSPWRVSL